ncbi:M56 family metallopeptidase [Maribacter ulvicola]|uniref:TonB family C-terminal domain-containing protein n=1 Tax=Maribacter ulvicola TaxID=228959 RepID=A0A1N6QP25_9FLAO|nr:M56 family metallopeptidase [Maribacter ulvicola]SIQ18359.1 TonB family C-terminal domain-containing protein [Maribacter ulvicola]
MIQYILECIAFQLLFLVIYDFFLKKETFFQWNRWYLLGTFLLSLILPWVKIEAFKQQVPQTFAQYPEYLWGMENADVVVKVQESASWNVTWQEGVLYGGMLVALLLFALKIRQLYLLRKSGEKISYPLFTQIVIANSNIAFSFFKSIFIGDKVLKMKHDTIIAHELVHIKQRHTYDLLFFEFMRIVGWFNPLVYVYQNRISELHEFIADAQVSKEHKSDHYEQLLAQVFQTEHISFINQFFTKSLIKKRIIMLKKSKSKKVWQLKYLLLVPMVLGMLLYTSCEMNSENTDELNPNIEVANISKLSSEQRIKLYNQLIELSLQPKDWTMVVKDHSSKITFSKAPKGSGISGPDGEIIEARMHIESKVLEDDFELFKTNSKQIRILDNDVPFAVVDEVPIFPGCEDTADKRACFNKKIQKHISKHFNYPKEAQEKGVQGRVNTMFMISSEGTIENIKMRGPDKLLEDEVERIIKLLPKMTPGKYEGNAVNVPFSIPVQFKLQEDNVVNMLSEISNKNDIDPLYYVDGRKITKLEMEAIYPDTIESVSVFKGEKAIEKYGKEGENGVVEIRIKKNK